MSNDELALQLSKLEGLVEGMASNMKKVGDAVDKLLALDRTIAEQGVRYENQQREIRELAHDIKSCGQRHVLQEEMLGRRIDDMAKEMQVKCREMDAYINKNDGSLRALKAFSGFASLMLTVAGGWAYQSIDNNSKMNMKQDYVDSSQQRQLDDLTARALGPKQSR